MVGGTRRYHHKSRNGCGQCKRRHIKCDLRAPLCANCEKRNLLCEYLAMGLQRPVSIDQNFVNSNQETLALRKTGQAQRHGQDQFSILTFQVDLKSSHTIVPDLNKSRTIGFLPSPWAKLDPPGRDRLRSHWSGFTAQTITIRETADNFLTRGIAASPPTFFVSLTKSLAALHMAYLRSSPEPPHMISAHAPPGRTIDDPWARTPDRGTPDLIEAYKHFHTALTAFRTQVTSVNRINWLSCIGFSMHVVVVNVDNARRAPIADFHAAILEPTKALRMTLTMRNSTRQQILGSAVAVNEVQQAKGAIAAVQAEPGKPRQLFEETMTRLDILLCRLERHTGQHVATLRTKSQDYSRFMHDLRYDEPPSEKGADSRLLAAVALRGWAEQIAGKPRDWGDLCNWQWCLSTDFMSLLEEKDDAALVVVIYWFVVIGRVPRRWYMDGWAQRGAIASLRHIGSGWDDILAWPKSQLGLDGIDVSLGGSS